MTGFVLRICQQELSLYRSYDPCNHLSELFSNYSLHFDTLDRVIHVDNTKQEVLK